jgi:hypothetical protein
MPELKSEYTPAEKREIIRESLRVALHPNYRAQYKDNLLHYLLLAGQMSTPAEVTMAEIQEVVFSVLADALGVDA